MRTAQREIEAVCSDIKIIIPPFGIVDSIKGCERYINGCFCQADAVIYTEMLESDDAFGYKFTNFTSRMNNHRLPKKREDGIDVNIILSEASKTKDWNTLNSKDNSIATKEFIAENLVQLLLIYVGCIYLYKRQYTEAIPVVKKLYARGFHEDSDIYNITANLLANAYLTAEQWEEQEKKDYDLAFNTLVECRSLLPSISYSLKYQLAMARVYMLKGDIKESKRYTKSINPPSRKDANGHIVRSNVYDWYIYINLAYYAIYERKPLEITTNYKKLFTSPAPDIEELEFAINFLKNELKCTNDNQFKMMLCHGLAFLHVYIDQKNSLKYLKDAEKYRNERGYTMLADLRAMITYPIRKLVVRK